MTRTQYQETALMRKRLSTLALMAALVAVVFVSLPSEAPCAIRALLRAWVWLRLRPWLRGVRPVWIRGVLLQRRRCQD